MADAQPNGTAESSAQYDLLTKLIPNLDRHMIYPLLEFTKEAANEKDIKKSQYELFKNTNMVEFVVGLWQDMTDSDSIPPELAQKQDQVAQQQQDYEEQTQKVQELLDDEAVVSNLRADKVANLKYLETEHGVTTEMIDMLYTYGRFQYECGRYAEAAGLLERFRILSTDNDKAASASWGKLAAEILTGNWEVVMEEVNKIKENIDTRLFSQPLSQLQNRMWLLHWALFAMFNDDQAKETLTDMFFTPAFINTIQTSCPWLLRYLAASVITSRTRGRNSSAYAKQMKDLTRVVRQEGYEYRDPLTDFVRALNIDFDFEEAQKKLIEAEALIRDDFFLHNSADTFVEAARHLISEAYCRIHQRIDIQDLSKRLGLNQDEGEKWIVNLIRDTRVDAKIDYKDGTVVMNHPPQSVYQQVIERTKGGFFRTQVLSSAVAK